MAEVSRPKLVIWKLLSEVRQQMPFLSACPKWPWRDNLQHDVIPITKLEFLGYIAGVFSLCPKYKA